MELWRDLRRDKEAEARYSKENKVALLYDEIWINDIYMVFVRKKVMQPVGEMTWLSIKRHDKQPCNDWRHFQFIKNQLVGEEAEAAQLYPAESRLVDGSNQYHLWCVNEQFPFGFFEGRQISEHPFENGKQRSWPINMRPKDMDEQNQRSNEKRKQYSQIKTKKQ